MGEENMKEKFKKSVIVVTLLVVEFISIFLAWKSVSYKETKIDEVKLKDNVVNNKSKKGLAIMLNNGDGKYTESKESSWPTEGYLYNNEKSGCIDTLGNTVKDVLTYNQLTNKLSLRVNKKVYCYLYFDKKEKPKPFTFYLGGSDNPIGTNQTTIPVYIKFEEELITDYCISDTNNASSCTWVPTNDLKEIIIPSITLSSGDGTKTKYAFLKDLANNISEPVSDSITLKTTISGTFTFYIGGSSNPTEISDLATSLYLSWTDNDVTEYCVVPSNNISLCDTSATGRIKWASVGSSKSVTPSYTFTGTDENRTLYAFLKDGYGNTKSTSDTIKYKKPLTGSDVVNEPISGVLEPTGAAQDELATRYYGTNPPNYICFGTTNKSTCTGDFKINICIE